MRKRSAYRPRAVIKDPIGYVIKGLSPMTPDQQMRTALAHHGALYKLTHGEASHADWETVTHMINTAVALSQLTFCDGYLPELKEAMLAHAKCGRRALIDGKGFGYTGPELQAVNLAADIVTEQLKLATMQEIGAAIKRVDECHMHGHHYTSVVQGRGLVEPA